MTDNLINNLTDDHKDALKEIGNIGAGNAATAFAQFLNCKIEMTVPSVEILPLSEVPEITGGVEDRVVGILLKVMGEAPGSILFVLSEESTAHLLNIITQQDIDVSRFSEVEISAIKEIGNILSGSYLSALNKMTGFNLVQSVPGFSHDMAGAILSSSMIPLGESSDYALLIETKFLDGGNEIEGYFILIPDPGSLDKILKALGFDVK
ncbi:chemotaxis protein CheC [Halothermothrix orenii]|uniref:CheC, inhibitor of MCP methylation n=1 Tax=Halothermothrix orenii (strain H 168 / OCM 544 / DSM 9562) TaxID=373903 RepID=B8CW51_HALOH|nr:chemotaxis protein CheC [Halothermothrix orenii]ACL69520.1 CheC, inhibitor of MCP methylation [Halothermothrix orenii H 168]